MFEQVEEDDVADPAEAVVVGVVVLLDTPTAGVLAAAFGFVVGVGAAGVGAGVDAVVMVVAVLVFTLGEGVGGAADTGVIGVSISGRTVGVGVELVRGTGKREGVFGFAVCDAPAPPAPPPLRGALGVEDRTGAVVGVVVVVVVVAVVVAVVI